MSSVDEVAAHERHVMRIDGAAALGLTLSGGGVRSAAFGLGILEELDRSEVRSPEPNTRRRHGSLLGEVDYLSTVSGGGFVGALFMLLSKRRARLSDPDDPRAAAALRRLRSHASYLAPGTLLGPNGLMEGLVAYGIGLLLNAAIVLGTSGIAIALYAGLAWGLRSSVWEPFRVIDVMLAAAMLIGLTWGVVEWVRALGVSAIDAPEAYRRSARRARVVTVVQCLMILGLLALETRADPLGLAPGESQARLITLLVLIALALWLATVVMEGATTTHHLFRDRIAAAFFPEDAEPGSEAATFRQLDAYRDPSLPLWLINTALNEPPREPGTPRRAKAAPFTFSPVYCGTSTKLEHGYVATTRFGFDQPPDVMHAVATSAAVVAPKMGEYSERWVWIAASLLNLRLGRAARRPTFTQADRESPDRRWPELRDRGQKPLWARVLRMGPLVARSLFRLGDVAGDEVYLTDGGHYDNLGVLSLLERRVPFIIAVDAEHDPGLAFKALADAVRRARTDLKVQVDIDVSGLASQARHQRARFAVGHIRYDRDGVTSDGVLVLLKPVLCDDEPVDVRNYAMLNPSFPHEPTANQFFSTSQFEAYRQLGRQTARSLVEALREVSIDLESADAPWVGRALVGLRSSGPRFAEG